MIGKNYRKLLAGVMGAAMALSSVLPQLTLLSLQEKILPSLL